MKSLVNKMNEGLGMSAVMLDADGAGYLGLEDSQAVQRYEMEFALYCHGLATEFLHFYPGATMAKQAASALLEQIGQATDTGKFTDDERGLVDHFATQMYAAIDKESMKSEWRRDLKRIAFRTPPFIRNWVLIIVLSGIVVSIALAFSK